MLRAAGLALLLALAVAAPASAAPTLRAARDVLAADLGGRAGVGAHAACS